ncbi:MAG: tripartite tricarboxylate transporter substrate-binding protein [Deltaproteobacteria bacterium]
MSKKKVFSRIAILGALLLLIPFANPAVAEWQPSSPISLMIGFKAGGGADTQARLVAEDLKTRHGWNIIPSQVTGKGGINLANAISKSPNDGTVIGMFVSETFEYNLAAAKKSGLKLSDFTPLVTTAGFQMGIVAKTSKGWKTFFDVIKAAKEGQQIRFGVMSPKLADIAYLLGKANGIDFNIVMGKGGKAVMDGLNAGDIDVGFVAGIQDKAVASGDMVNLASGLSTPLKQTPDAPLLKDLGLEFNTDGYFMFAAPAGLPDEVRQTISNAIAEIVTDPSTKAGGFIKRAFGEATAMKGAELERFLNTQYEASLKLLKAASE